MTLFSIAGKNIRKNFTNYFLYFASMIFSIVIYFTFVSLKYDNSIQSASDSSPKISSAFSGAAVVLIIFVAIFIWYSNSFFTRKRKKEVGLYSLLGVRKKQIGRMLFYENFLMGVLALIVGIALGSVLSRFFVMILMKAMGYDAITNFSISLAAIVNTFIVFMIITLITSFQGYRLIYRFKLIELFHADQLREKEPKASWLIALLSLVLVGIGYWLALQNLANSKAWATLGLMVTPLVILVTVILGTYLLFNTLTVTMLKLSRRNKKRYWKGLNIIGTSQLLYRIKGNARTLTIIAVLSATTLTAVGTAYSLYYSNRSSVSLVNPNSLMFISTNSKITSQADTIIQHSKEHDVLYHTTLELLEMDADTSGLDQISQSDEQTFTLLSNRDFNRLAKQQGRGEALSLHADEAAALDPIYIKGMSPEYVGSSITLSGNGDQEKITFKDLKKYSVLNQGTVYSTIVVSDDLFAKLESKAKTMTLEAYGITHQDKAQSLTKELEGILPEKAGFSSFYRDYASGMESSGLLIFMGGFLGLVFLAATGSIIYFKQLTEANSDKARYLILYKIGVKKREIRKTVAKQVMFIFALPLIAGIAHCAVALSALSRLMQTSLVIPVVICMGIYTCIYLIYYFVTVNAYYKIVTNVK
ncbi:FtsX-like permease family protein [Paenibacillus sp. HJL G12]|uniref:FtsX-like permease family protein n=1 Tax=Paenibacillus dendrobii TaxID=2691084 RepID=A0A7X3IHR3_9BACL|nr:ABC transporter permease [Paenibacillus dendrobii]MWV44174.1 FtsX-like permease family protein [Paenibacillus dendrobii]